MKKIILSTIAIFFCLSAYNQVINGTILDIETDEKVPFASIYFNGTFVGTASDSEGNFTLDISNNISMPLTISCIGYYSLTLTDFSLDEPLQIYLKPKRIETGEVVVSGRSLVKERRGNLRLFKKVFLGTSVNAQSCEILNEEDITFNYGSDRDTIKAYASKPIIVKNEALGYTITYYLDIFEYDKKSQSFLFKGNSIFEEDFITKENTNDEEYKEKRENAYLGSRMHFLRTLWVDALESSNFTIKNSEDKDLNYSDIVIQQVGNLQDTLNLYIKYISYPTPMSIYYNAKVSTMHLKYQRVFFDKTGYDSPGIIWEGEMLTKRIGDSLPLEYEPN